MKNEIRYELTQPIKYAHKGDQVEAGFLTLNAPSSKNMSECAFLKQAFFRALPKDPGETEAATGKDSDIDGDAIMMIIAMSPDVDLAKVMISSKKLLTSGVALVDGEAKLTMPLADLLSNDDLEKITGDYLSNFILASALQKLNKN